MNPAFGSRRRADEFDVLLSRSGADSSPSEVSDSRYAELVELVATLREVSPPDPRPEFSADLRSRLMVAAESALAPDSPAQSAARRAPAVRRSARERRLVAAVGGFAIVSATASMAVAAQSALPGDTLYPLKRAIENAQTGVQRDADGKGATLLANSAGRLDEVGALSRSGDDDATTISTTLDDFVTQATQASDLLLGDFTATGQASSIEELRTFTSTSMGSLTRLQDVIPQDARSSLIKATQAINAIDVQAQGLCPACTDLPIMQAPAFATQALDTLLTEAIGPILDPILAPSDDSPPPAGSPSDPGKPGKGDENGSKGPAKDDGASGPTTSGTPAAPVGPSTPPSTPALPPGPKTPDAGGPKGDGGTKDGGLLDNLNVDGSEDPLGDLLTGAGETVDDVLGGLTDGLSSGLGGLGGGAKN